MEGELYVDSGTGIAVDPLPWLAGRPWGGSYACLLVRLTPRPGTSPRAELQDENCGEGEAEGCVACQLVEDCTVYCAALPCLQPSPAARLAVRGLCPASQLDRTYSLTVDRSLVSCTVQC